MLAAHAANKKLCGLLTGRRLIGVEHNPHKPFFDLNIVKEAAAREDIIYERKARTDIVNLGYELSDVISCLQGLTPQHFDKPHTYINRGHPQQMDAYVYTYTCLDKSQEERQDQLYIKLSLVNGKLSVNLASFHLSS